MERRRKLEREASFACLRKRDYEQHNKNGGRRHGVHH
jgi:hypothetical protein